MADDRRLPRQGRRESQEGDGVDCTEGGRQIPHSDRCVASGVCAPHQLSSTCQWREASEAALVARKELGLSVDYRKGARDRLLTNFQFMDAFRRAKERVGAMEFRAVENAIKLKKALLEINGAIVLDVPLNDFGTYESVIAFD